MVYEVSQKYTKENFILKEKNFRPKIKINGNQNKLD